MQDLFTEAVADDEDANAFVQTRLKQQCFEIFKTFDEANQAQLIATVDALVNADGQVHPAEAKFRAELGALLNDPAVTARVIPGEPPPTEPRPDVVVSVSVTLQPAVDNHVFFASIERPYATDRAQLSHQVATDRALMDEVIAVLDAQRARGQGRLAGKNQVTEFTGQNAFLDGHVHVVPPEPNPSYELTVLGDLHGCYSCLKAALLQSDFFAKVNRYQADPARHPNPKLVLLGDYIDRGMFSYHGVLRTVMQLFVHAPEHVYVLRGNHEYYIQQGDRVYGAVKPSEAMDALRPVLSTDVFRHYMRLFDALPTLLLFDRFMFVHAGIPRDWTLKERYQNLASFNDWAIRFQMMWSDPSAADIIPAALQEQSARFAFGRLQCQAFLHRVGCHTLVRGHEKINEGFRRVYDDDQQLLISLFSAGGRENRDLPARSAYRAVTPMAMTIHLRGAERRIVPWLIDYQRYNDPARNGFYDD